MNNNQQNGGKPLADPFGAFISKATGNAEGSQMNNMAANMVKDYAIGQVQQQFDANKGYFSFMSVEGLKVYFDVTNSYVMNKLKIILFPFLLKEDEWKRG